MIFSSPTSKSFSFPVAGGQTIELAIAQFWSSGIGSHETTIVDFEVSLSILGLICGLFGSFNLFFSLSIKGKMKSRKLES